MEKKKRLAVMVSAMVLVMALFGSFHVFAEQQTIPYMKDMALFAGGVTEEEGDIDIPIQPVRTLRSMEIETKPAKLEYRQGEPLDLTGLKVRAYYSDYTHEITTDYQVSGYDPNVAGEQVVTVSLRGKTDTFKVKVYIIGDVDNLDGVTGRDATLLLQHAANWDVEINAIAADIDGNGSVDGRDATLLLQYVAGWNVPLVG